MDRAALAHKCERIEKAGGSVLDYLRSQGCISPWGTWHRLQREELCRKDYQIRDGKGNELMKRYTAEQKQKAIDIALSGENPRPYLRSIGCSKPDALWHTIKKALKESDPETYARIPNFQQKINVGAEALMGAIPEGETVTTCCARSTAKGVEVPEDIGSDPTTVRMSGCVEDEIATRLLPHVDALNIDLKSFDAEVYRKTLGGDLETVRGGSAADHGVAWH